MEVLPLIFAYAFALGFLVWAMRFKSFLSFLAIPFMLMIVIITLFLNSDATLEYTIPNNECGILIHNTTATTEGNITTTQYNSTLTCQTFDNEVSYTIPAQLMTITNFSVIVGMISIAFVIFRRVTRPQPKVSDDD